MKLSTRARYALRMLLDIGEHSREGKPVKLEEVARRTGISRRYLDQIVLPLKNEGLLRGVKGPGGGYLLGKDAEQLDLASILEAELGPISLVDCVLDRDICARSDDCTTRLVYRLLSLYIRTVLKDLSVSDLLDTRKVKKIQRKIESMEAGLEREQASG